MIELRRRDNLGEGEEVERALIEIGGRVRATEHLPLIAESGQAIIAQAFAGSNEEFAPPMNPLRRPFCLFTALVFVTGGCNHRRTVDNFTLKRLAPGVMAVGDVGLGCASAAAFSPALIALRHRGGGSKEPRKAAALASIAAGMCSARPVWEVELERSHLRYMAVNGAPPALKAAMVDLTIKAQRLHREAAARNLAAYQRVVEVYGAPTEARACPTQLRERDELLFLLGMTAGLMAILHDIQAERSVGVSPSIPRRVVEGAGCLNNERWWGLPGALQSAVAGSFAGLVLPTVDPWVELETAAVKGEASGLWLGRALQLQTAHSAGREEDMWRAIEAHGAARVRSASAEVDGPGAANADYGLLNAYASEMIEFRSDVFWIRATGRRTPLSQLGMKPSKEEKGARTVAVAVADAEADAALQGLDISADELEKISISGAIYDASTRLPLVEATVRIQRTLCTTETNSKGYFKLQECLVEWRDVWRLVVTLPRSRQVCDEIVLENPQRNYQIYLSDDCKSRVSPAAD